jgi:hypothetical protein
MRGGLSTISARSVNQAVEQALERYRDAGFRIAGPDAEELPRPLRGVPLNYLALSPARSVAIQVRRHEELTEAGMRALADAAREAGWGFAVVVPDTISGNRETAGSRFGPEKVDGFLLLAGELAERGETEAAVVLLRTAAESAARFLAGLFSTPNADGPLSLLLRQLVTEGLLDRGHFTTLRTLTVEDAPEGMDVEAVAAAVHALLAEARAEPMK